jgi:hypothetical protein
MKRILQFGAYVFEDTGTAYSDNFANLVLRSDRLPGLAGGFDELGSDPAPAEIGRVNYTFWLRTNSRDEMKAARDAVKAMAGYGATTLFMQPEDPAAAPRFTTARVNNISMPERADDRHDLYQRASVIWQVADPHWYEIGTEAWNWGAGIWGAVPWGGGAAPQACSGVATDFTITTQGNAVTLPRITITCAAGQVAANPKVQRLAGGEVIDEIATAGLVLGAGDALEINCRAASVKLNGADAYSYVSSFKHPDWLRLLPGENVVRVALANNSDRASVKISYYEAYV